MKCARATEGLVQQHICAIGAQCFSEIQIHQDDVTYKGFGAQRLQHLPPAMEKKLSANPEARAKRRV